MQIQVLQMELGHERERASMLEERVNQLRRAESGEGSTQVAGQSEAALELRLQEADSEMVRLRADLLVSSLSWWHVNHLFVSAVLLIDTI